MADATFYVYSHSDAQGAFYVGKGRGRRAYDFSGRSKAWRQRAGGSRPRVEMLHKDLTDSEAKALEAQEIEQALRDFLKKMSDSDA